MYIPYHLTRFVLSLQDPIQLDYDLNQEEVKNAEDNQEEWVGLLQESISKEPYRRIIDNFQTGDFNNQQIVENIKMMFLPKSIEVIDKPMFNINITRFKILMTKSSEW